MNLTGGLTDDIPTGEWGWPIVRPHWPTELSVTAAVTAAVNRGNIATLFQDYQGLLDTTRTSVLAPLEGMTADAVRRKFEEASGQAAEVTRKNNIKKTSYEKSGTALDGLRSDLKQIAAEADSEINEILGSKKPAPQKVTEIVAAIQKHSQYAAHKAITYGNVLTTAVQDVLTAQGDSRSVEEFAAANGIPLSKPPTPTEADVRKHVEEKIRNPTSGRPETDAARPFANNSDPARGGDIANPSDLPPVEGSPAPTTVPTPIPSGKTLTQDLPRGGTFDANNPPTTPTQTSPGTTEFPATPAPNTNPAIDISHGGNAIPAPIDAPTVNSDSIVPSTHSVPTAAPPPPTFGPQEFADSFTHGMQTGVPLSGGTEALTQNTIDSAFRPQSPSIDFTPTDSGSTAATPPVHHGHETSYTTTAYTPPVAEPSSTMYAAPIAPVAPIAPAPPVAPVGPLPTYGSDIRPPVVPPPAPAPPLASAPASAPVNPSAGASALNQQAVMRQVPTAAPQTHAPAGLTENAVAAAGAGAISGAVAEQSAKTERLQRLLESVSHQEPRLRWAIGEYDDGTTVLITDLASGWIPPHVQIPTGVEILPPAARHGGLETLIGGASLVQAWAPGQYLAEEAGTEPVLMSLRSRDLPAVDDLNWELTQATNWRDGLPRLAHTLAKVGIAGTGVLDSETDLLREHLAAISEKVLTSYPTVDIAEVGNWQLLAAIDALIAGRRTTLNYHFAWFQALHTAPQGGNR